MQTGFPHLLGPGRFGPLELRNRLAMCPMGTNLAEPDGTVGDAQRAWFEARARGGAGLIIVGSAAVAYPSGSYDARQIAVSDDRFVPGLEQLTAAVHAHGAAIAAQLVHDGPNSLLDIAQGRPLLVPSPYRMPPPDELSTMITAEELAAATAPFVTPTARLEQRVATHADLAEVIERFAAAARLAVAAGFDGIELHAGHGYLLDAFLSPATNRRDDRWGGDAAGRAQLLVEVVRAVRLAVGGGFPLWARINAEEHHRSPGQTFDDALVAMRLALDAGLDGLHVTAYAEPMVATGITDGHTPHRAGALVERAAAVKRALGVPVMTFGRLTPEMAEEVLRRGDADVIAMGRPLIADPDLPRKLAEGGRDRIRPCAYQYRCIGSIFLGRPVRCAVNADAGREAVVSPTGERRRVVVAGAGPAGLEAARRFAGAGHDVEVWERSEIAGGLLRVAERIDEDLAGLADWLEGAASDAGVTIHLGRAADPEAALSEGADLLVWATGADWQPALPVEAGAPPTLGIESVDLNALAGDFVIVGGGKAALSVALQSARIATSVTVVATEDVLAPQLGLPGRFRLVAACRSAGITLRTGETAEAVVAGGVRLAGGDVVPADEVCVVQPATPPPPPPGPPGLEVVAIGDADGPAGLAAAFDAAASLEHSFSRR